MLAHDTNNSPSIAVIGALATLRLWRTDTAKRPPGILFHAALDHNDEARMERIEEGHSDILTAAYRAFQRQLLQPLQELATVTRHFEELRGDAEAAEVCTVARALADMAFEWHCAARTHVRLGTLSWRAAVLAHLWLHLAESAYMDERVFHRTSFAALETMAACYPYATLGAARDEPVGRYSVLTWYTALEQFKDGWERTGWTPASERFLQALLVRYAMFLEADADGTEGAESAEAPGVFDDPLLCDAGQGGQRPRLRPRFLTDLEPRLLPMWRQGRVAATWYASAQPVPPATAVQRVAALDAWVAFARAVSTDDRMRTEVLDRVRDMLARRLLRPGEASLSAAGTDPDMVLCDHRPDMYMTLQPLLRGSVADLLTGWAQVTRANAALMASNGLASPAAWEQAAGSRAPGAAVALLVFETCFDLWIRAMGGAEAVFTLAAHAFVDDQSLSGDLTVPPATPDAALRGCDQQTPVFVAIAQVYGVVTDHGGLLVTPVLTEALTAWLVAAVANGRVRRASVHSALHCLL
jgi:hypothetical protein